MPTLLLWCIFTLIKTSTMKAKYIRVSTKEQNTDRQKTYNGLTYVDYCSGSIPFNERPSAIELIANKDITSVMVHSIDRLGRNTLDILNTIQFFTKKGINVISEKEGLQTIIDGKENPIAKLMIGILGTLSEFEYSRIKDRQREGIAAAKKRGTYFGRKQGSNEPIKEFMLKPASIKIIKYLKQNESIARTALLSQASEGTVKKIKKLIKDGKVKI